MANDYSGFKGIERYIIMKNIRTIQESLQLLLTDYEYEDFIQSLKEKINNEYEQLVLSNFPLLSENNKLCQEREKIQVCIQNL